MTVKPLSDHRDGLWALPELVDLANSLLPGYLPKESSGRVVEEVNPRLVRHYTTQGLLPEARKEGREARYLFEHLLSLLVVRRLLAEGFSSVAIKRLVTGASAADLVRILEGGVEIRLAVPAPSRGSGGRLEFLREVRARAGLPEPAAQAEPPLAPAPAPSEPPPLSRSPAAPAPATIDLSRLFKETRWTGFTVADGLELFVRDDFSLPATRLGDEQLLQIIKVLLLDLEQKQRSRP